MYLVMSQAYFEQPTIMWGLHKAKETRFAFPRHSTLLEVEHGVRIARKYPGASRDDFVHVESEG